MKRLGFVLVIVMVLGIVLIGLSPSAPTLALGGPEALAARPSGGLACSAQAGPLIPLTATPPSPDSTRYISSASDPGTLRQALPATVSALPAEEPLALPAREQAVVQDTILAVAGYNGQPTGSTITYLPIAIREQNDLNTTLFIQNTAGDAASVAVYFYDATGLPVYTASDLIPPHGSLTYELATTPELYPGFEGSAVIASDQPILAVVNVQPAHTDSLLSYNGVPTGATEVVLPMIMRDYYGWNTDFWVQNVGDTLANVTMTYSSSHVANDTIPPRASNVYRQEDMPGLPSGFSGSVIVQADQPVAVVVEIWYSTGADAAAYNGIANAGSSFLAPRQQSNVDGWSSSTTIMNVGAGLATIDAQLYESYDGSLVWTETNMVPPGEYVYHYVPYLVPDGFDGALEAMADQPLATVVGWAKSAAGDGYALNPGIGRSQLQRSSQQPMMHLPRVAHVVAEGVSTQFSIQNAATVTEPAEVMITFYHKSGVATAVVTDMIPHHGVRRYATGDVSALGESWEGSVTISADQPIAVEAVQFLSQPPPTSTPTPTPTPTRIPTSTTSPTSTATPTPTPTATATPNGIRVFLPLILKQPPLCDPYEPNDVPPGWGPLVSGQNYQAKLCWGDSQDYYRFTITSLDNIVIDLDVPATVDYHIWLYHESDTAHPVVGSANIGKGVDEHIDYTPTTTGTYYIRILPRHEEDHDDVNSYTLVASFR